MDINLIKSKLKEKNMTYEELSQKTNLSISTIKKILSGSAKYPRIDTIEIIEKTLGINRILNEDEMIRDIGGFDLLGQEKSAIPLVGDVIAGVPIETSEYIEGFVYVGYKNPEEYFALKVHGDSMINAGITEKSILIVHKQSVVENGDIAVVAVDGKSTVKRYKEINGVIFLMPENPAFEPIPITQNTNVVIFGKVVQIRTDL